MVFRHHSEARRGKPEVVRSTDLLPEASGFHHGWKPALKTRDASVAPAARFKLGYRKRSRNPTRTS